MIESNGLGQHVFRCNVPRCEYERTSTSPGLVKAAAAWHTYEQHPVAWMSRNGSQKSPSMPKPVNL